MAVMDFICFSFLPAFPRDLLFVLNSQPAPGDSARARVVQLPTDYNEAARPDNLFPDRARYVANTRFFRGWQAAGNGDLEGNRMRTIQTIGKSCNAVA
jgi:hypothetical protein